MSSQSNVERLKTTPIEQLNLDSTAIRRQIIKRGFHTLPELLDLPDKEIDKLFDWKYADEIINLQKRYRSNPEKLAASVLQSKEIDEEIVRETISKVETARVAHREPLITRSTQKYPSFENVPALTQEPFEEALKVFETRAKEVFDELDDRFENVMVYQAFEEFSTDLDELDNAFEMLFRKYSHQPRWALGLIDTYFPNSFTVYVANRARSVFKDNNLWENFFEGIGIRDSNIQSEFKRLFVKQLEKRGMPLYCRKEETNYYFYTALLHGGLSEESWSILWEKLLAFSHDVKNGIYGYGRVIDGHSVLNELKNPGSRFTPNKSVLNILEKAPASTIAPLFEASMRVAAQIDERNTGSRYTMLSSFGLPDAAMDALRKNQEHEPHDSSESRSHTAKEGRPKGKRRLIYLPTASLQLDLSAGMVSIRWPRQQFPLQFSGARIDYYVGGEKKLSSDFVDSVGKCILDAVTIDVRPQARYDIELRLMYKDEQAGEFTEASSLNQTFTRSKPGCFEFIKDGKGTYRLRGQNERITKKRRVAYIVQDKYRIEPGQGMKAVSEYEASGGWHDAQILIYDVEPGSSGVIIDRLTNEEVAVWQERYIARIDKRRIIGETLEGLDLYGQVPNELGTNSGLPSMTIEAIDGPAALDDLEINCICDGRKISVPRRIAWEDNDYDGSRAAKLELLPHKSDQFDLHIESCLIEARQKSADNKVVFKYRFSVIPVQGFKPSSLKLDYGRILAEYEFQTLDPIEVENEQGSSEIVNTMEFYTAKTLLKDEYLNLRIRSRGNGKETDVKLGLAAIDIKVPETLARRAKEHPICLADALDLSPADANFRISAHSWKYNRALMVMLGDNPLFFKEFNHPGEYEFNLLNKIGYFKQTDGSKPKRLPLMISLCYGDDITQGALKPAWTDIVLIECAEGIGIKDWRLALNGANEYVLRFDGEPMCDATLRFIRGGERLVAEAELSAGQNEIVLPANVTRRLSTRNIITVEILPTDSFGDPQQEYKTSFKLTKR